MPTSSTLHTLAHRLDRLFGWLLAFSLVGTVFALPRHLDDPYKIGAETFAVAMAWVLATLGLTGQALRGEGLGGRVTREPAWIALALFALWVALSALWAPHPALHARFGLAVVAYLLAGHAVLGWIARDPAPRRTWAVGTLAALVAVECFWGFLQWAKVPITELSRLAFVTPGSLLEGQILALGAPSRMATPMGSLGNQNYLAELLSLAVPVVLGFALSTEHVLRRRIGLAVVGAGFIIIVACYTRAAVLGLAVGAVVATLATGSGAQIRALFAPPQDGRGWVTRGVLATAIVAGLMIFGGPLFSKFGRLMEGGDQNASSRVGNWQVATTMVAEHPLTGVGLGGWKVGSVEGLYRAHPEGLSATLATARFHQLHNDPLQAFVELGLVGGLLASAGGFFWMRRVGQASGLPRPARFGLVWGLSALLLSSFFAFPFHVALTALTAVFVLAIGLVPEAEGAPEAAPVAGPDLSSASVEGAAPELAPVAATGSAAPSWAPAWAAGVFLVVGLLGWQAYARSLWPAYMGSHLQHLAEHTERRVPNGPTHGMLFAAALRIDPFKPPHLFGALNGLVKQGKFAEAVAAYEAHRNEGPGSDSLLLYARALEQVGRRDDARATYERVCMAYPPSMRNHQLAARHLAGLGGKNPRQAELEGWMRSNGGSEPR